MVIPKAMAIALIAGLDVETGLYTALASTLVYPLLGGSRPLSVTSTSAIAMLTAAQVIKLTSLQTGVSPAEVAATLALLVGAVLIAARMLRLGFLGNFISKPVLVGFEAGVGAAIVIGQFKSVLGVELTSHSSIGMLMELPGVIPETHIATLLVATLGVVVLLALPRTLPRLPAILVWVAFSIVASIVMGLAALGVATIGTVPSGLPRLALPNLAIAELLWPAALGIALMSITESLATARAHRRPSDGTVDANQELLAIGAANVAAAIVGGLPAGGGASQTAVAEKSGPRSQLAQWVTMLAILLTLLFLSGAIGALPKAALGSVILVSAIGMIKPREFLAISRVRRDELVWALATVAGILLIGTLEGILIAVAVSLLMLIYQANHPPVYAVAYNRKQQVFRPVGEDPSDEMVAGMLMLRTEGRVTFANIANISEKMQALVSTMVPAPRVIVLECSAIPDIEYTALVGLIEAEKKLREQGVSLWLAAVNPGLRKIIERSPLGTALSEGRVFANLRQTVEAWEAKTPSA
jgi:MFS superfamily sulfate permease-like transporter